MLKSELALTNEDMEIFENFLKSDNNVLCINKKVKKMLRKKLKMTKKQVDRKIQQLINDGWLIPAQIDADGNFI